MGIEDKKFEIKDWEAGKRKELYNIMKKKEREGSLQERGILFVEEDHTLSRLPIASTYHFEEGTTVVIYASDYSRNGAVRIVGRKDAVDRAKAKLIELIGMELSELN